MTFVIYLGTYLSENFNYSRKGGRSIDHAILIYYCRCVIFVKKTCKTFQSKNDVFRKQTWNYLLPTLIIVTIFPPALHSRHAELSQFFSHAQFTVHSWRNVSLTVFMKTQPDEVLNQFIPDAFVLIANGQRAMSSIRLLLRFKKWPLISTVHFCLIWQ